MSNQPNNVSELQQMLLSRLPQPQMATPPTPLAPPSPIVDVESEELDLGTLSVSMGEGMPDRNQGKINPTATSNTAVEGFNLGSLMDSLDDDEEDFGGDTITPTNDSQIKENIAAKAEFNSFSAGDVINQPSAFLPDDDEDLANLVADTAEDSKEKSKILRMALTIGGLLIGVLVVIALLGNFLKGITGKSKDTPAVSQDTTTGEVVQQKTDTVKIINPVINYSEERYVDTIQLTKYANLKDGMVNCYFSGRLKNFKQAVTFQVPVEVYNRYEDADIINVTYYIARFSEIEHLVDIEVKEG